MVYGSFTIVKTQFMKWNEEQKRKSWRTGLQVFSHGCILTEAKHVLSTHHWNLSC